MAAEATVGGSISKQYKIECERAEKRKLEAETKAAAAEELRKKNEAKEAANGNMSDSASTSSPSDSVAGLHNTSDLIGNGNSIGSAASSSSLGGSSAAVAPAMGDINVENSIEGRVDQYENLRPVWHGQ